MSNELSRPNKVILKVILKIRNDGKVQFSESIIQQACLVFSFIRSQFS
jgi:hypothetical protein